MFSFFDITLRCFILLDSLYIRLAIYLPRFVRVKSSLRDNFRDNHYFRSVEASMIYSEFTFAARTSTVRRSCGIPYPGILWTRFIYLLFFFFVQSHEAQSDSRDAPVNTGHRVLGMSESGRYRGKREGKNPSGGTQGDRVIGGKIRIKSIFVHICP